MMQPKRTKFRKQHKGRNTGLAQRGNAVSFGEFALMSMEPGWITAGEEDIDIAIQVAIRDGLGNVRRFERRP